MPIGRVVVKDIVNVPVQDTQHTKGLALKIIITWWRSSPAPELYKPNDDSQKTETKRPALTARLIEDFTGFGLHAWELHEPLPAPWVTLAPFTVLALRQHMPKRVGSRPKDC